MAGEKIRIDKLLFDKGLAPSRERAQAFIMAGRVLVNHQKIEKSGIKVAPDSEISITGLDQPYVSRGGLKLEKAIKSFHIPIANRIIIDIGASTGGFTDCLLQHGAAFIFSIDTGYNQLVWKLKRDDRVKSLEKTNFRYLEMESIGTFVDIIVIDVSFISLRKILPNCLRFLVKGGELIMLIKPQFEAGREHVKKGGIVSDAKTHAEIVDGILEFSNSLGFQTIEVDRSPITGKKSGNKEFLAHLKKPFHGSNTE